MQDSTNLEWPKLRWPIEVQLLPELDALVLRCPLGLCEPLVLRHELRGLLALFDGRRSVKALAEDYSSAGVTPELLTETLMVLDHHYFLDSPRFVKYKAALEQGFKNAPVRMAALAGRAYPESSKELLEQLGGFMPSEISSSSEVFGLVTPHIDYGRGGWAYGKAYSWLHAQQHDLLLLLGTAHQYGERMFVLTEKDFITPLGLVPNAREVTRAVSSKFGFERSYSEELRHRTEHSLELQLPFLQLRGVRARIVPILVGSFHRVLCREVYPEADGEYQDFVGALTEVLKNQICEGASIGIVAGVDMAHVGKQFGDKFLLTADFMESVKDRDQSYLACFVERRRRDLHDHIAEDGDARRICGYPSLYTLMDICERLELPYQATVIDYHQAIDPAKLCGVTFASIVMTV